MTAVRLTTVKWTSMIEGDRVVVLGKKSEVRLALQFATEPYALMGIDVINH